MRRKGLILCVIQNNQIVERYRIAPELRKNTHKNIVCPYSVGEGIETLQTSSFGQFMKQKGFTLNLISNNEMVHRHRAALGLGNKHKNIVLQ